MSSWSEPRSGSEEATAQKMETLHNYIAEHFAYKNDSLWYQEVDRSWRGSIGER
ncbi:MAG: hypothetical protein IPH05_11015 [Flavobacteriales bacterium]|nr:hypothetical protein [Flavobacteriales bacterium]